jgi:hypothetical protein
MEKFIKYIAIADFVVAGFTIIPVATPADPSP